MAVKASTEKEQAIQTAISREKHEYSSTKASHEKDMSDRDSSVRRIGADSDPTAIVDQLLSQATSSVDRAQIILDTLINASEAGHKRNEIVAIVHSKAEREQSWTYLGLNKEELNTRIQYDTIVAPAVEAF